MVQGVNTFFLENVFFVGCISSVNASDVKVSCLIQVVKPMYLARVEALFFFSRKLGLIPPGIRYLCLNPGIRTLNRC